MYGLIKQEHLKDIALSVVNCLGNGTNNTALKLLMETAQAETGSGTIRDSSKLAGMGITQFDWVGFRDTLARTNNENKGKILDYFSIHIEWVTWEELRYNPLLSMIFTRLKYKLIPEEIPITLEGRATYWKKYYNSEDGKGTIEHYLEMNKKD